HLVSPKEALTPPQGRRYRQCIGEEIGDATSCGVLARGTSQGGHPLSPWGPASLWHLAQSTSFFSEPSTYQTHTPITMPKARNVDTSGIYMNNKGCPPSVPHRNRPYITAGG